MSQNKCIWSSNFKNWGVATIVGKIKPLTEAVLSHSDLSSGWCTSYPIFCYWPVKVVGDGTNTHVKDIERLLTSDSPSYSH